MAPFMQMKLNMSLIIIVNRAILGWWLCIEVLAESRFINVFFFPTVFDSCFLMAWQIKLWQSSDDFKYFGHYEWNPAR